MIVPEQIVKFNYPSKHIENLKRELKMIEQEELEYSRLLEPSRTRFEKHTARLKRFREITQELLRLANEKAD